MNDGGDLARAVGGDRRRLGEILLEDGAIDAETLRRSLDAQRISRARIGDILIARERANRTAVAAAVARQSGHDFADFTSEPPDPALMAAVGAAYCIERTVLPWRRADGRVVYAAADAADRRAGPSGEETPQLVAVEARALREALIRACGADLAQRSVEKRPPDGSLRAGLAPWQKAVALAGGGGLSLLAAARPDLALAVAFWSAAGVMTTNCALWAAALIARPTRPPLLAEEPAAAGGEGEARRLADYRPPPRISLLVPLYREPETAPLLLKSLSALDYPPELLDIKIILESDDASTFAAIMALSPPPHVEVLIAPDGAPRTKPRALNFALEFTTGDIIGVYDAEDRPAPDQLWRIVRQFAASPPEVACIQARLGYYNAQENWLTRCFEVEYASWFDAMLPGLYAMGLPIPLGGTSLFIRRRALDAVGGWDSHNVTEDADLGMMLARLGMRTALSSSMTEEEASSRAGAWVRQRSRWLKGYLCTWLTHMRRPARLLRELGPRRFVGFNAILLSAVFGYLLLPWLWAAAIIGIWIDLRSLAPGAGAALLVLTATAAATLPMMFGAAAIGLARRGRGRLLRWALTLPAYWVLGACAAYLAAGEIAFAPSKWRKTQHGVGRIARKLRAEALS